MFPDSWQVQHVVVPSLLFEFSDQTRVLFYEFLSVIGAAWSAPLSGEMGKYPFQYVVETFTVDMLFILSEFYWNCFTFLFFSVQISASGHSGAVL